MCKGYQRRRLRINPETPVIPECRVNNLGFIFEAKGLEYLGALYVMTNKRGESLYINILLLILTRSRAINLEHLRTYKWMDFYEDLDSLSLEAESQSL